jgi:hypothetical protein
MMIVLCTFEVNLIQPSLAVARCGSASKRFESCRKSVAAAGNVQGRVFTLNKLCRERPEMQSGD